MSLERLFHLLTYLLVGIGFAMLALSRQLSLWVIAFFVIPYLLAFTRRFGREDWLTVRQGHILTWLYVPFFLLDTILLSRSFVIAALHLILFVQLMKIYQPKRDRDYFYLIVLSFLEVLAASSLTVELSFLFFFLIYAFLCICCLIVFEFKRASMAITSRLGQEGGKEDKIEDCEGEASELNDREAFQAVPYIGFLGVIILVSASALGAALFFALPRFGSGTFHRTIQSSQTLSGFSDHIRLGGIGSIQLDSSVVMRIRLSENSTSLRNALWRGLTLDFFDGKGWSKSGNKRTIALRGSGDYPLTQWSGRGTWISYQVLMEPSTTGYLFALDRIQRLRVNAAPVIWDPADDSLSAPPHPFRRLVYQAESLLPDAYGSQSLSVLTDEERRRYLQLPSLDARVAALAKEISSSATDEPTLARKTEKYLQDNYRYTLEEAQIRNPQPLESFLFETRKGHCEYFATAMVVLLRNLGVPSRIVNGFRGGDFNEIAGDLVVRARTAHSWVEVFIPDSGWSSFDPTPAAVEGPQQTRLFKTLNNYLDALDLFWGEWILGYDSLVQTSLFRGLEESASNWARLVQNVSYQWIWQLSEKLFQLTLMPWRSIRFTRPSWVILLLMLCAAMIGCTLRFARRMGQYEAAKHNRQTAAAIQLYTALSSLLKSLGRPKSEYLTPNEFAATFAQEAIGHQVREITTIYNLLRFGSETSSQAQIQHAYQLLDEIKERKMTIHLSR